MNAAIYARKSTEQSGVAEEAKSVTRQIDNAKAYALKMGWSVVHARARLLVDRRSSLPSSSMELPTTTMSPMAGTRDRTQIVPGAKAWKRRQTYSTYRHGSLL
jgi:hypothetical protein